MKQDVTRQDSRKIAQFRAGKPRIPRRPAPSSLGHPSRQGWHWSFRRDIMLTLATLLLALLIFGPANYWDLQQQAGSYVAKVSWFAVCAMSIAAIWTVLPYGSSKQKTDTFAALVIFAVLICVHSLALALYVDDRNLIAMCEPLNAAKSVAVGPGGPDCNVFNLANAGNNARELDRISTLVGLGQIVPLLSILKDVLQAWAVPDGADSTIKGWVARRRARYTKRRQAKESWSTWVPVYITCLFPVVLIGIRALA